MDKNKQLIKDIKEAIKIMIDKLKIKDLFKMMYQVSDDKEYLVIAVSNGKKQNQILSKADKILWKGKMQYNKNRYSIVIIERNTKEKIKELKRLLLKATKE
jgi:2-hydroxy-3-keto-5-methylthiopentenyl-1-phosphate phosphatase